MVGEFVTCDVGSVVGKGLQAGALESMLRVCKCVCLMCLVCVCVKATCLCPHPKAYATRELAHWAEAVNGRGLERFEAQNQSLKESKPKKIRPVRKADALGHEEKGPVAAGHVRQVHACRPHGPTREPEDHAEAALVLHELHGLADSSTCVG